MSDDLQPAPGVRVTPPFARTVVFAAASATLAAGVAAGLAQRWADAGGPSDTVAVDGRGHARWPTLAAPKSAEAASVGRTPAEVAGSVGEPDERRDEGGVAVWVYRRATIDPATLKPFAATRLVFGGGVVTAVEFR